MIPIIIIDNHYFDVTEYANKHPGGANIIKKFQQLHLIILEVIQILMLILY